MFKQGQPPRLDTKVKRYSIIKMSEERMAGAWENYTFPSYQSHYTRAHKPK